MIKKLLFDVETTGLLNYTGIDYSSMPYKIKDSYKVHCICAKDVDTGEVFEFINDGIKNTIPKFISLIKNYNIIIGHNIVNFDLLALRLTYNLDYEVNPNAHKRLNIKDKLESFPDTLFGNKVKFVDTMILSKLLNPDRSGGHSLKNWGKKLGFFKGTYGEEGPAVWEEYDEEMLSYCHRDVELNIQVYEALIDEMGDYAVKWQEPYQLELAIADLVTRGEHFGFHFDVELAEWCVKDLNKKLQELEDEINPQLPMRSLPESKQPAVPKTFWKNPFNTEKMFKTKGGLTKAVTDYLSKLGIPEIMQEDYICSMMEKEIIEGNSIIKNYVLEEIPKHPSLLTTHAINFGKKHGYVGEDIFKFVLGVEDTKVVPKLQEKMTVDHKDDLKQHIISLGWKPSKFDDRDIMVNSKKKKRTREEVLKAIDKYVKDTVGSEYEPFRCKFLKVKPENLKEHLIKKTKRAKRFIIWGAPQYTIDKDKNLCPNLEKIKKEVPFIDKVVKWGIYGHRRNNILSPNGTGFLANKRIEVDSRIPTPANTLDAATGRFTHIGVANIARVTTLYGEYMRSLFGVSRDHFLLTADADGLENRREGSLVYKYPGGPEYAEKLEAAKPNDWHTLFAKEIGIERSSSKNVKFGLSFGQQIKGLADRTGWSMEKATKVFNDFWEKAYPLKALKDNLEAHWESNGKDFVVGIDGRLHRVRAKHVLINLVTQGGAICIMKRQHIILDRMLREKGLLGDPFKHDLSKEPKSTFIIAYHDETSQQIHKDLVRLKSFDTKEEAEIYKRDLEDKGWVLSDINHGISEICDGKYFIAYSEVITLTSKSMEMAGEYYNQPLKFTQAGQLGLNWSQTH